MKLHAGEMKKYDVKFRDGRLRDIPIEKFSSVAVDVDDSGVLGVGYESGVRYVLTGVSAGEAVLTLTGTVDGTDERFTTTVKVTVLPNVIPGIIQVDRPVVGYLKEVNQ